MAEVVLGEAQQRGRERLQPAVGERVRGLGGARRPLAHPLEVAVVQGVGGELGVQRGGRRAVAVVERVERRQQPRVRGVVVAEQVLARRAGGDQAHAQVGHLDQRERVVERVERPLQPPGGGERAGQRHEQAEPPERILALRRAEQPQRGLEPARGDRGSARGGLVAGLLEHRRRLVVTDAGRARRRGARAPPAHPAATRARRRHARAPPAATPRRRRRRPRGARADGGSDSGAERRSRRRRGRSAAPRSRPAPRRRSGRPPRRRGRGRTARPRPPRPTPAARARSLSPPISCPSAAATDGGTPTISGSSSPAAAAGAGSRASSSR